MKTTRVWIYPEKEWAKFGSERWNVETELVKPAAMGKDEIDMDRDLECISHPQKTHDDAIKAARKLVQHDRIAFGAVRIQRQVVGWYVEEDRVAEWQDVGDAEEFCYGDLTPETSQPLAGG